jgi:deoxyribonuclease-4
MRFGFHISIAGGFSKVVERAKARRCETIQFFSRNPRGWKYGPLNDEDVEVFRSMIPSSGLSPLFLHLPYLPNIAYAGSDYYTRSVDSIVTELHRAEQLGAQYLIVHMGHRMDSSEEQAMEAVCSGISQTLDRTGNSITLLLENTAGQGSEIGSTFEQIGRIVEKIHDKQRVGICLDTAHAFEAGYDLSNQDGIERTLEAFERCIGLKRLHLLHLNDSKTPLGSRKDRHWHIGKGHIGLNGFRCLVNHPQLRHLPGIMETPRKGKTEDRRNMRVIRSLVE